MWNRSPAQAGCMRQVLRAGALGCPRGMGWGGRREGGLGWGTHVNPWLIHVNVWQKPLQYYKVISLQLIKINGKKRKTFLVDLTCQPKDTQPPAIASFSSLKQFYGLSKSSLIRWAIVYLHSLCFPFALQVIIPANTFFFLFIYFLIPFFLICHYYPPYPHKTVSSLPSLY